MEPADPKSPTRRTKYTAASFGRIGYGCLTAAGLLLTVHLAMPSLSPVTKFLLPVPLALVYVLFGPVTGLSLFVGVGICLVLFASYEYVLKFAVDGVVLAVVLGEHLRRGVSPTRTIVLGVFLASVVTISAHLFSEGGLIMGDEASLNRLFDQESSQGRGVLQQLMDSVGEENARTIIRYLMLSLPALLIVGAFLYTIVGFVAFRAVIKRIFGEGVCAAICTEPFSLWHAPDYLIFSLIASAAALLVARGAVFRLSLNCLIVAGVVYFIQGLAVAFFFVKRLTASRAFQWLGLVIVFLMLKVSFAVLSAVGIVDVFLDFRKVRPKHTPQEQQGG